MAENTLGNLMRNRDAIRKIMAMDNNGTMDKIAENARNNGVLVGTEDGVSYNGVQESYGNNPILVNENIKRAHSKMPRQILESFEKNPGSNESFGGSILDSIPQARLPKVPIKESQQSSQNVGGIDYSLLKTIINEAVQENVKKYMSALSRKLINEGIGTGGSDNQLMCLKIGSSFSFIGKDGTVYEAQLKKKYNINEQKKH